MKTTQFNLPEDLAEWMTERAVVRLVLDAISEVKSPLSNDNFVTENGVFRPNMLLSLITCAYAFGVYGTQDMEDACRIREGLKYLCAGNNPDASTLRRFRRKYSTHIQEVLRVAMEKACVLREECSCAPKPLPVGYLCDALERWLPSTTPPDMALEAERRMRLALTVDSISDE